MSRFIRFLCFRYKEYVFFICYFINRGFTGTAVLCWITQNSNYNTGKIGSECYNNGEGTPGKNDVQKDDWCWPGVLSWPGFP